MRERGFASYVHGHEVPYTQNTAMCASRVDGLSSSGLIRQRLLGPASSATTVTKAQLVPPPIHPNPSHLHSHRSPLAGKCCNDHPHTRFHIEEKVHSTLFYLFLYDYDLDTLTLKDFLFLEYSTFLLIPPPPILCTTYFPLLQLNRQVTYDLVHS